VATVRDWLTAKGSLQIIEQTSMITRAGNILIASGSARSLRGVKTIKALGKSPKGATEAECDSDIDNTGTSAAHLTLGLARGRCAPSSRRT
jgi:hypothetical protein